MFKRMNDTVIPQTNIERANIGNGAMYALVDRVVAPLLVRLSIAFSIVVGFTLIGLCLTWISERPLIQFFSAIGVLFAGIAILFMSFSSFIVDGMEVLLHVDFNRDGKIGSEWVEDESDDELTNANTEADLEKRFHRALMLVCEQAVDHQRRELSSVRRILSQSEWKLWWDRSIAAGILSANGRDVLAVSYPDARDRWLKYAKQVNKGTGAENRYVDTGLGKNPMVPVSGLWGKKAK